MCERNSAATCSNHTVMTLDDTWIAVLRRPGWVKDSNDELETPQMTLQYSGTVHEPCTHSPWTRPDCARAAWRQSIVKDEDMI